MKATRARLRLLGAEVLGLVTAAIALAFFAWLAITVVSLTGDLRQSNVARDALVRQVRQMGGEPVAGPPGSRGDPGQSIVGPPGPSGAPGADSTVSGPPGVPGLPGKDSTVPGPSGLPGASSTVSGPPGVPGLPGKDSTVPGPSGPPGKDGVGQPGRDGAAGQPPVSWTFTSGGATYTCARAPGFDPSNPQYVCSTPAPSAQPSPSASSSPPSPLSTRRRT